MPTTQEERPYDGGLGTGGKFRKRPFRKSQPSTPYDRPPTALRNPNAPSNGWLSKLVDPAQRILSAGAQRLFSSVFRKRLLPPTSPPSPEASQQPRDEHQEAVSSDPPGAQDMHINGSNNPSNSSNRGGLTELEQILMQKTFSRSEVDRLTTLLHSKSDEVPVGDEEKRFEMVHSKPMTLLDRKEGYLTTPLQGNGFENRLTSTPVVSATVLDDDVASPAEVAKAYMGSRPSKVSPLRLGLRGQAFREDSNVISNPPLPVRSPVTSLVPVASGHASVSRNGFVTPRPRGRSAIYNMARTPYSRVNHLSTIKDAGHTYGGPSSSMPSQYELELRRPSVSQQGVLKRRSSVLDNDIGSVGPMRRIRQKANIVYQKGSSSPIPGQYPSSSTRMLTENGDHNMPDATFTPVPSKSKEMASKILQQLEKLTPKEKSPTKLSPSMLSGKALKSLENLDSSKVFQGVHDIKKLDGSVDPSQPDAQKSTLQKKEQGMANGPTKFLSVCDASASNSVDKMVSDKNTMPSVSIDDTRLTNSITQPPQKKQAFQMSAHEDFLEMDDDVLANGVASSPSVEPRAKLDNSVPESKTVTPEAVKAMKPSSESKPPAGSILNEKSHLGASNGSVVNEKSSGFALSAASSKNVQPAVEATSFAPDKPAFSKESNAPHPIFSFGGKVAPSEEPSSGSPMFSLGSKNAEKMPQSVFVSSSSSTPADSSGLKWGSSSASPAGAIGSAPEVPTSAEAGSKNNSKSSKTPETAKFSAISTPAPSPSAGIFTFGGSSTPALNNGSHSFSTNPLSSSVPLLFPGNTTSPNPFSSAAFAPLTNTTTTITSSSLPLSASPVFKFGSSSSPSSSALHTSGGSVSQSAEAKVKQEANFGNSSSAVFGGASLAPASTGSSIFGFSASAASTANSQSQGSTPFGISSGSLSSPAGSAVATATTQFGSSGSTPSFGIPSSSSFSFGSSTFGSSTPAGTLPSSGSRFGASSSANTVSSSSGTFSGLFGSSTEPTKSPIFGSSFNSAPSSTGFSFGASSASAASTTTASMPFGSSASSGAVANSTSMLFGSTTGASSASPFSFTSAATGSSNGTSLGSGFSFTSASPTTSSQPVFGFGAASSPAGNDQMNTEDSMAEDNVQAAPTATAPIFSQQPFSPAPSSFTFGSAAPSPAPAGANSFQFGGQPQNTATQPFQFGGQPQNTKAQPFQFGGQPQNTAIQQAPPSPFQASGSLDFNASGNFSLGSGGGDKSNRRIVKPSKGKYRRK